ncbi:DUF1178 family protein [Seohaeicola saemankumensis]|uniref:DUF1178 family protein n=1 Tax=Seohaeicola saemankumensis TaxID=481181 RepID=A0ABW3T824_9RHOB
MIQFSLRCSNDHRFDSWFQSSEAYDKLAKAGMISCTICGATSVDKAVMAPRVRPARDAAPAAQPDQPRPTPLAAQATPAEQALAALRQHIEAHSDYVGRDFAREARAIHDGEAPDRAIFGEARPDEARRLLEDGVPIAPLPFLPRRKTN